MASLRRWLLLALILLIPCRLRLGTELVTDPDLWLHLRTGDWILQHGAVPHADPFSSLSGHPWVAYSWSFEVLLSVLYRGFGLFGLVLLLLCLSTGTIAALFIFLTRRRPSFARAAALTALGAVVLAMCFTVRPWLFTILFLIVELGVLFHVRNTRSVRWLWVLPPLLSLWANLHIQFAYGFVPLLLAAADQTLASLVRRCGLEATATFEGIRPRTLWSCLAASAAATLVNPYHVKIYHVFYEYASYSRVLDYVAEFRAMDFRQGVHFLVLGLLVAGVAALARRPGIPVFDVLLLLFAAAVGVRMVRDVWFPVVVVLGILADDSSDRPASEFRPRAAGWLLGILVVCLGVMFTIYSRGITNARLGEQVAEHFPEKAAEFVQSHNLRGPLFNDYDWAGYLIWRLPELPVSIDGRNNLHGDRRTLRSYATWTGAGDWAADPELARANLVIGHADLALASLLRCDPRFRLVYEDKLAVVFVANPARQYTVFAGGDAAPQTASR